MMLRFYTSFLDFQVTLIYTENLLLFSSLPTHLTKKKTPLKRKICAFKNINYLNFVLLLTLISYHDGY
jgi:hypothetical protein